MNAGLDETNAILTFDFTTDTTTAGGGYNGIVAVANTDGTDGNSYNQGIDGRYFGTGTDSGMVTLDFTDLVPLLNPAINPNYSTLRLIANKDGASTATYTIDNIAINTVTAVPEPGSAVALAVVALGAVGIRRRRK